MFTVYTISTPIINLNDLINRKKIFIKNSKNQNPYRHTTFRISALLYVQLSFSEINLNKYRSFPVNDLII